MTPGERSLCPFLALAALSACHVLRPDDHALARTTAEGQIEGRPTLGMPVAIPGRSTCLIPFSVETRKWLFQDRDPYTRGGHASGFFAGQDGWYLDRPLAPGGVVRWHNAIVSDLARGEQWPILSQRGVIGRWQVLGRTPARDEAFRSEAIVFVATLDDTNHDRLLDDRDAAVAIVADGDGRSPRPVTPRDAQVWDYSYDAQSSRLYLLVVADSDADGVYTTKDGPVPFVLDTSAGGAAVPVVSDDIRGRVEALLR